MGLAFVEMTDRSGCYLQPTLLIIVLLASIIIVAGAFLISETAAQGDPQSLAYQAYTGLANVYSKNGAAPDLLDKLNSAVDLIQRSKVAQDKGDSTLAAQLNEQARTQLTEVINQIPQAQQNANLAASNTMLTTILLIPISTAIATFIFYVAVRTWRGYERLKLYEMEIVEKEKA